jgi:hypothetical protein
MNSINRKASTDGTWRDQVATYPLLAAFAVDQLKFFIWGLFLAVLLLSGCDTTTPQIESLDYMARAETLKEGGVRVSAVVLSPEETKLSFAMPLDQKKIQPVWIEIENRENKEFNMMLLSIDPNYFAPSEVAWLFRNKSQDASGNKRSFEQLVSYLDDEHIPVLIPPHTTVSGFVYTNLDPGRKAYSVDVFGQNDSRSFEFVQSVPGFKADFSEEAVTGLYAPSDIKNLNYNQLRRYLEDLQCCVAGGDKKTPGDPINLVIVGRGDLVISTLARRGWDLTETAGPGSIGRIIKSSIFKSKYRTSPVSALYVFGRQQDVALQKARRSVDERNHMRLWRAPVNLNGEPVWVGGISRDIGVKLSSVTVVTHKIDPMVDEARFYVTLDAAASQSLKAVGYVSGVGYSDSKSARFNYTKDPYYTDGNRAVLILSDERRTAGQIQLLQWENVQ